MSPCTYGFALSGSNSAIHNFFTYAWSGYYIDIDVTKFDTSQVSNFSQMFSQTRNMTGLEFLNTSNGTNFNGMFQYSFFSKTDSNYTLKIPLDLRNIQHENSLLPDGNIRPIVLCYYMFGNLNPNINKNIPKIKFDFTGGKGPILSFVLDNNLYYTKYDDTNFAIDFGTYHDDNIGELEFVVDDDNMAKFLFAGHYGKYYNVKIIDGNTGEEITDISISDEWCHFA